MRRSDKIESIQLNVDEIICTGISTLGKNEKPFVVEDLMKLRRNVHGDHGCT
jgi:hypothetical protein